MNRPLRSLIWLLPVVASLLVSACSSSKSTSSNGQFTVTATAPDGTLQEGGAAGINIPVSVNRLGAYSETLTLSASAAGESFVITNFSANELTPGSDSSTLNVTLAIADLPIAAHSKTIQITATDGTLSSSTTVALPVQPTSAPDIYLLVGQSNMVGFSGDGTKQALPGGPDEPLPRIKQLNVTKNDQFSIFTSEDDFVSEASNALAPLIVQAEDPLHIPFDESNTTGKDLSYIGLGLSFAKAALPNTTTDIILVPAAWSGSAFCDNFDGPIGQWNAQPTSDANLGNTWLFDRAITRANMAIDQTGGVLRGILWHQGESDANERCAGSYAPNLERMAQQLRLQIQADARGGDLRRPDANIPFVVGTMSKGSDSRGDLSMFSDQKLTVDAAHRNISQQITHAAFSNHDDLVPANGFACGNTTCIHFGPQALREMGSRYYQALLAAINAE